MVEVKVNPGVCGLESFIKVNSDDEETARDYKRYRGRLRVGTTQRC